MMTRLQHFLLISLAFSTSAGQSSSWSSSLFGRQASSERRNHENKNSLRSSGAVRGGRQNGSLQESIESRNLKKEGRNMGGGGMGGGNGGVGGGGNNNANGRDNENAANGNGIIEPEGCTSWDFQGIKDRANAPETDDECRTNSCGGGCCRVYNWLICDTSNSFKHLQCVCNENTSPTPPPSPRPTWAPVTATPTTGFPTTAAPVMTTFNTNGEETQSNYTSAPASTSTGSPANIYANEGTYAIPSDREDDPPGFTIITTTTPAPVPAVSIPSTPGTPFTPPLTGPGSLITPATPAPVPVTPAPIPATAPPVPATIPPVPSTAAPVPVATAAPVTRLPTPLPPTTAAAVVQPTGPIQAWQQCEAGSIYHDHDDSTSKLCHYAEDCKEKKHCCIRSFCMCGDPGDFTSECVPSRVADGDK